MTTKPRGRGVKALMVGPLKKELFLRLPLFNENIKCIHCIRIQHLGYRGITSTVCGNFGRALEFLDTMYMLDMLRKKKSIEIWLFQLAYGMLPHTLSKFVQETLIKSNLCLYYEAFKFLEWLQNMHILRDTHNNNNKE